VTVAIATAQSIAQSVLVPSLRKKQEGAIDKPGTVKVRETRVKRASGDGGVKAWLTLLPSHILSKKKQPLILILRFPLRKK